MPGTSCTIRCLRYDRTKHNGDGRNIPMGHYPRVEGGTKEGCPKQKHKIHCDGSDSTIVARNRVSWVGCRGTIIYDICSTRLSRKGILKILVAFPWHIVLDISLFLIRCRRRYLCESIKRWGCYNIIEYQAWFHTAVSKRYLENFGSISLTYCSGYLLVLDTL